MSPPRHTAKLPSWSYSWYRWYCRVLVHHMYVSRIDSLMSCLPPLHTPRFGSEEPVPMYVPHPLTVAPCTCDPKWRCEPHGACFIHDSCFCPGSGSFPPVKPSCMWLVLIVSAHRCSALLFSVVQPPVLFVPAYCLATPVGTDYCSHRFVYATYPQVRRSISSTSYLCDSLSRVSCAI